MSDSKNLPKLLDDFLKKHDISTAFIIFRDPDSNYTYQIKRGDSVWLRGALAFSKASLDHDWNKPLVEEEENNW